MADIDTVLERLVSDGAFRTALGKDPAAALAGYDLNAEDLQLLASSLDDGDTGQRGVEQRTSKSAVVGLLASLTGGGGGGGSGGSGAHDHVTKGTAAAHDLAAPKDDTTEALRKLPGKPKPGEITLTRSVTTGGEAPPDPGTSGSDQRHWPIKYTGNKVAPTDAPPDPGTSGADQRHIPIKWHGPDTAATDAPPDPGTAGADQRYIPIKWHGPDSAATDAPPEPGTSGADQRLKAVKTHSLKVGATDAPTDAGTATDGKDGIPVKWQGPELNARKLDIPPMKAGDTSGAAAPPEDFLTIEDE